MLQQQQNPPVQTPVVVSGSGKAVVPRRPTAGAGSARDLAVAPSARVPFVFPELRAVLQQVVQGSIGSLLN